MSLSIQSNSRGLQFSTVADMRLQSGQKLQADQIVFLAGGSALNDGTGGAYAWDATSTATDDGVQVIKLDDTTTGRFVALNSTNQGEVNATSATYINATEYGVVGDGLVDDTAAINALFANTVVTDDQRATFFPAGIYRCTDQLNINTPLGVVGEGDGTIFRFTAATDGFVIDVDSANGDAMVRFDSFTVEKNGVNGGSAIKLDPSSTGFYGNLRANGIKITEVSGTFDIGLDIAPAQTDTNIDVWLSGFRNEASVLSIDMDEGTTGTGRFRADRLLAVADINIGKFDHVQITGLDCSADVNVSDKASGDAIELSGFVANYSDTSATPANAVGRISLTATGSIASASENVKVELFTLPAFRGHRTSIVTNVVGDGTTYYQIVTNSEDFDTGGDWDGTEFVAPLDGRYQFSGQIVFSDLPDSNQVAEWGWNHVTSADAQIEDVWSRYRLRSTEDAGGLDISSSLLPTVVFDMTAGDKVHASAAVGIGGANPNNVDIYGTVTATGTYTYIEGRYIGGRYEG